MGKGKQLGNKIKGVILANKKKITFASITLLCILVLVIGWIYHANKEKQNASITPELARAMNYPEVVEGDEAVEGTDYVKFDAFFLRDINFDGYAESIRGTSKEIGSEDTLYMELNVQTQGYLKDAKITINGENFYLQTALPKDDELKDNYVGNNIKEIAFNTINNGTQKLITGIVRSGDYSYDSRKAEAIGNNINNYSKVNSVTLTGTYVGETGEVAISKTVDFTVDWYGTTEARIYTTNQTYDDIVNRIDETSKTLKLNFTVNTEEVKEQLLLKKNHVEIQIPDLNGFKAIEAKYTGESAISNYDAENRKLTIEKIAEVSEEGSITKGISRNNNYTIEITYPIEAYQSIGEDTISIKVSVQTHYEGYNNPNKEFMNPYISNIANSTIVANYSNPTGSVANIDVIVGKMIHNPINRYIVSKQKPLKIYNGLSSKETGDIYQVRWYIYTGSNGESTGVILKETENGQEQKVDQFIKANSQQESMENLTTNIGIGFSNVDNLLQEDGWIKIYDDESGSLLVTFTREDWNKYTSSNPYKYEIPLKHVRVETSNTKANASMYIYHQKELDDTYITTNYTKEQFDELQYIESNLVGYLGGNYIRTDKHQARYEAPYSIAQLNISNNTISTQATEKNEKICIVADYDISKNQIGWINGTFLVKLPKEILNIEVHDVTIDSSNVSIQSYEIIEQEGSQCIKINTKNNTLKEQAYTITIDIDITPDPRIATMSRTIELYATNENVGDYYYKKEDIYDINGNMNVQEMINHSTTNLSMVSPNSLLTNQVGSNYDNKGSEVISPQIADVRPSYAIVDQEEKTAQIGVQIKNNYASTISEIKILGKIPFKGNTFVLSGGDLGSTFTTKMQTEGIQIPEELQEYAKVYYSEQENPDINLQNVQNGWYTKEQVNNWDTIKTFMIDLENYIMPTGAEYLFNYTIKIPNGIAFNEVAYSHHGVYFCLDTDQGKYKTQTEPNKLGFRIAEKYNLELTKKQTGRDKVVSGATYSIKEQGQKKGKTATTNAEGKLQINNLYAEKIYELQEIKTPEGYELNDTIIRFIGHVNEDGTLTIEKIEGELREEFSIIKEEGKDYTVTVGVQDEVRAKLIITKQDKETKTVLAGIKYSITGKNLPEEGKVVTTNVNGMVTIEGLSINEEYTLQETEANEYYIADPIKFKITNSNGMYYIQILDGEILQSNVEEEENVPIVHFTLENEKIPTYDLQLVKVKKTTELPVSENIEAMRENNTETVYLEGAKFKLYKGTKEIGEYITNSEGIIRIEGLYQYVRGKDEEATYTLKEVLAPDGYAKVKDLSFRVEKSNGKLQYVNLDETEEQYSIDGNTITITIEDSPSFRLIKKDKETGQRLANTKFSLYDIENGGNAKNSKGEIIGTKEIINGQEYYVIQTDQNGEITLDLSEGLYKIVEVEAPQEYSIQQQSYYFGIGTARESEKIVKEEIEDEIELDSTEVEVVDIEEGDNSDIQYRLAGEFTGKMTWQGEVIESYNPDAYYNDDVFIFEKRREYGSNLYHIGGNENEQIYGIVDGKAIIYSTSSQIHIISSYDSTDQIIKNDKKGEILIVDLNFSQANYTIKGGDDQETIYDVIETEDEYWIIGTYYSKELGENDYYNHVVNQGKKDIYIMMCRKDLRYPSRTKSIGGNGYDSIEEIVEVDDGYILMVNSNSERIELNKNIVIEGNGEYMDIMIKLDKDANVMWAETIDDRNISITKDGGYIETGLFTEDLVLEDGSVLEYRGDKRADDLKLLKYSPNGDLEIAKSYTVLKEDENKTAGFYNIGAISLSDGGFLLTLSPRNGQVELEDGTNTSNGVDIKYNKKGELEWYTARNPKLGGIGTSDGGVLIYNHYSDVIKINSIGEVEWEYEYRTGKGNVSYLEETDNGNYIIEYGYFNNKKRELISPDGEVISTGTIVEESQYGGIYTVQKPSSDYYPSIDIKKTIETSEFTTQFIRGGGFSYDYSLVDVLEAKSGDYIAIGSFSDNVELENDLLESNGSTDVILMKFSPEGIVKWAKGIGGTGRERIYSIIESLDGNYYAIGQFESDEILTDTGNRLTNKGKIDNMIIKFTPDGNILWTRGIGGEEDEELKSIIATEDGGCLLAGDVSSKELILENGETIKNQGKTDLLLVKYDDAGKIEWTKLIGGMGDENLKNIILTQDKGYLINATFENGSVSLENGIVLQGNDYESVMIIKCNADGKMEWAKDITTDNYKQINSITEVQDGYYAVGYFRGETIELENGIILEGDEYNHTGIIIKYQKNGEIEWAKSTGEDTEIELIQSTKDGGYLLSISFSNTVSLENGEAFQNTSSNDSLEVLLVKYQKNGEIEWAEQLRGLGDEYIKSIIESNDGGYLAEFKGNAEHVRITDDIVIGENLDYVGFYYNFIVKYDNNGNPEWAATTESDSNSKLRETKDGWYLYVHGGEMYKYAMEVGVPEVQELIIENSRKEFEITTDIIEIDGVKGGTISGEDLLPYETVTYGSNSNKTIEINPDLNFEIKSITVNGQEYPFSIEADGTYTMPKFENMTEDKHIEVTFLLKTSKIIIQKVDKNTQAPIPEVKFKIEKVEQEEPINVIGELIPVKEDYYFIKNETQYESNNQGQHLTTANSYIPIDLSQYVGKYKIIINAQVSSERNCDYGFITITDEVDPPTYDQEEGRIVFISGEQEAKEYTAVIAGGKKYYLHLGYYKDNYTSKGDDKFTINSIQVKVDDSEGYQQEIKTDKNGQAITQLPFGKYKITEIQAPEGYQALEAPIEINFTSGGQNTFTIENEQSAKVIVHHYIKDTTEKVAEDELLEGKIDEKYTTEPKLDLPKYELIKDENGSYILPENATGKYVSGTIEVTYYYEEKQIPLTVHHYIEGTETKVPLQGGGVAEDVRTSGKENEPYETTPVEESILSKDYELVEMPANATGTFAGNEVIVTYYYKQVKRPFILQKQGEDGVNLAGVTFAIQNKQTGETKEYVTDQNGKIELELVAGDYTITENKTIEGYDLPANPVTNITIGKEKPSYEITLENSKTQGNVIVHHYIQGTEEKVPSKEGGVVEDETKTGTVGEMYATKESDKIQPNYKFVETKGETSGLIKEGTTEVFYYYQLQEPELVEPSISKESNTTKVTHTNQVIDYTITYHATLQNYIGTATVTIVDTLPYEIDTNISQLAGGVYNETDKTITWTERIENIDTYQNDPKEISITKEISLLFKNVDQSIQTIANKVVGTVKLETPEKEIPVETTKEIPTEYLTEVEAVKVWEDNNNADGNRPSSIYLQLKKGEEVVDEALVSEGEGWRHTFTDLPKYETDGTEITYNVEEREVNAGELKLYDKKIEGNTITNTYKLTDESIKNPKIEKTGTKAITSKDEAIEYNINYTATIENYMGTGRVTIVDTLPYELDESKAKDLAGGTYNKEAKTITWVEELGEVDTFTNGPEEVNITKTITVYFKDIDVTAEKIINTVSGKIDLDITKETDTQTDTEETNPSFTTEVEVIKRWEDNNNENKRRPQSIKFVLTGNGQTYEQIITASNANPENSNEWKYTFTDLPKYDEKGKEIIYLVNEEEVEENSLYFYEKKVEGNIITNTFKVPEDKITITVNKEWKDTPEQAKQRPQTITFKVLGEGGQEVGSYVLDTSKETSHTFTDLPKYNNKGQEITYTIKEEMNSKFYTQSIGKLTGEDQKEILVTNTFVRPEDNISITVTKTWEDQDNKYDRRPDAIKVQIWNGDVLEAEDFAIEKEDWIVTFDNLPKYDENGQEIVYQVKEEEAYTNDLYNYTVSIGNLVDITENQKECTITNTMTKVPGMVEVLYLDKYTGKEISTTIEKEGIVGESFDVTEDKKEIPGYTLVEEPKDKTGIYTEELQQKIYYYAKNSNVIVKYLEKGTGEVVAKQEEILGYEGKIYSTEQKQIPDYTFVESTENVAGTMGRDTIEVIYYYAKNTKVIVRYLEKDDTEEDTEDNKVLAQPDTIEGYEGKEYETTAKEIPDYTFIECIGNSKGTMTEDTIEIIYYYSQDSMVIIKYLEKDNTPENTEDNTVLAEQEIIPGHEGKEYTTNKKDIPNYTFVESTDNVKGTIGKEPIIVIYYYLQNTKATVQHIDRETGTILKQETREGVVGDIFQTHAEDFEGYVLVQSPEKPNVPMEKEEIILKYYYAHISAGVIEKHIDVITGEILDSKAHTGNEGDPYDIPAKTFEGYDVVEEKLPTNSKGNMTKERIEVKYYYSKKAQVRVEYIDKQTEEKLVPDVIIEGHENDLYETEQKQFENYSLEKIPNNWKGNMTITKNEDGSYQTEIVVTYYYIKKSGGVIEKHIDITSGKELAKEEHKGNVGDSYHIPAREFSGYELVKEKLPSNSKGTMQEKEIEVIYYYVKLSKVTVEYIDKDTGEKLDQEEIKGYEKDPYETEEKEFDGYTLVEVPKNATGTMTNKDIVVQYYYRKKVNVEVQYLEKTSGNILAESETLQGYVGDPYETKAKDITYYNLVEQTENTKGKMTKDKITVIYYYKKQNFNLAVDKWVSKVSLDGITQTAKSLETKDEIYKIDIHRTKTETSQIKVTYKIRITNKGEIEGTVDKLTEIIPLGYHLNPEDNKLTWKENKGILVTEDLKEEPIAPGKYKEIEIVLRWDGGGENIGMKDNIVILSKTSNPAGYQDMSKEDDISKAQMMIAIASGLDSRDRIVVVGIVEVVIAITIGMLVSYRKKNKKK